MGVANQIQKAPPRVAQKAVQTSSGTQEFSLTLRTDSGHLQKVVEKSMGLWTRIHRTSC